MRKLAIIFTIVLAAVSAVDSSAQFRYGPQIGVGINEFSFSQKLFTADKMVGGSAGVACEFMFPGIGFGVDFGLQYAARGAKLHLGEKPMWADKGFGTETAMLHMAEIPLHLRFKYSRLDGFEDKVAPFIYAGPTFGFTLAHSDLDCMRFPFATLGIDMGIGAELFHNWQVSVAYTLGLSSDVKAKLLTDFVGESRTWSVRVAYLF